MTGTDEVTQLLSEASAGDQRAMDRLLPLVYDELRALAQGFLKQERPGHTLQATAIVHEAYLKLVDQRRSHWRNRAHFFAVAAEAIRRILVDHARGRGRQRRGGGRAKLVLDEAIMASFHDAVDVVALDDALARLADMNPQQTRIVQMRFFGGLNIDETAEVLKISPSTVERDWRFAWAWLFRELSSGDGAGGAGEETP